MEEPGLTLPEADRRACGSMMERRHPEGWRRAPGGQLRYWTVSGAHGRPGGPGFVPASRRPGARDGAIGRSARARIADMGPVPDSHRFLIRPSVRIHGLASLALRLAAERVADDWRALYGVRPVPAYTPVGPDHAGTGYRAEPERGPGHTGPPHRGGDRAEREYARSGHPDGRVHRRTAAMGGGLDPQARGTGAGTVPGQGGPGGGLQAAPERWGDHGRHTRTPPGGDGGAPPPGAGDPGCPGHGDAELRHPGGDVRAGRARRWRKGHRRHPRAPPRGA